MDPNTPVTVEVERDGLYQVTIFPIREGRGILDTESSITTTSAETVSSAIPTALPKGTYTYLIVAELTV